MGSRCRTLNMEPIEMEALQGVQRWHVCSRSMACWTSESKIHSWQLWDHLKRWSCPCPFSGELCRCDISVNSGSGSRFRTRGKAPKFWKLFLGVGHWRVCSRCLFCRMSAGRTRTWLPCPEIFGSFVQCEFSTDAVARLWRWESRGHTCRNASTERQSRPRTKDKKIIQIFKYKFAVKKNAVLPS